MKQICLMFIMYSLFMSCLSIKTNDYIQDILDREFNWSKIYTCTLVVFTKVAAF
jgi:hypothetical protein